MKKPWKYFLVTFTATLPCLLFPQWTQAQAHPTATGPGSYIAVGGEVSLFQADYGKQNLGGFNIFADIHPTWRYGIEAEARFLSHNTSEDVTETDYLIGPIISIRPGPLRPYVKFLVGAGNIVFPFKYATGSYLAYAPGAGLEYLIGDRFAIRIIDFEYQSWPSFTYGELHPYGISAGISYRLNDVIRLPKHAR